MDAEAIRVSTVARVALGGDAIVATGAILVSGKPHFLAGLRIDPHGP
jgi:hypothetical protein